MNEAKKDPDKCEEDNSWEVEYLIDKRLKNKVNFQYLVKWVGYDDSYNQWVNEKDLTCHKLIEEFNESRCPHIKNILSAHKNDDNSISYMVSLYNGAIEEYPSSYLKKNHYSLLKDYLEKLWLFNQENKLSNSKKIEDYITEGPKIQPNIQIIHF